MKIYGKSVITEFTVPVSHANQATTTYKYTQNQNNNCSCTYKAGVNNSILTVSLNFFLMPEPDRISRGNRGNLFILKMVDPSYRVPL